MGKYGGKADGLRKLDSMNVPVPKWTALSWNQVGEITDSVLENIISKFKGVPFVAVRSSADNEDGTSKSFAGVFSSVLNVPVEKDALKNAIAHVVASAETDRVAEYDGQKNSMGIVIQQMVQPILSGVAFTRAIDTTGHDVVLIEAVSGLGDKLVSGLVTPTRIKVPIQNGALNTDNVSIAGAILPQMNFINSLFGYIQQIIKQSKTDLDTEWCIDADGNVWFVQARPITAPVFIKNTAINSAIPVVGGMVTAPVYVISELGAQTDSRIMQQRFAEFPDGAILVALYTEVDFVPIMKRASGIITEQGGILSHAAILAREIGIPCIVNYPDATKKFKTGDVITMNATTGHVVNDTENGMIDETSWMDEAWNFDNMIQVPYRNGCVFVESLFNRTNVYAPWVGAENAAELDMFIRKKFGVAANLIIANSKNDMKFFSWFENREHKKLPGYRAALERAYRVAASGSARMVHKFYADCINTARKYIPLANNEKNAAVRFFYQETIMAQYILLDVIFPRAIALHRIYIDTADTLHRAGATFADLLAGKKIKGITKRYHEFIRAISDERNDVFPKFKSEYPPIDGYWTAENQDRILNAALDAIGIDAAKCENRYLTFMNNIRRVKSIINKKA